jgi:hypothetical protein
MEINGLAYEKKDFSKVKEQVNESDDRFFGIILVEI